MNSIIDTHAHYHDSAFDADRHALINSLPQNGILAIINSATDLETAPDVLKLAERYPFIYATIGIHPLHVSNAPKDFSSKIQNLLKHPKVVGIGEIGLDYHYDSTNKAAQKEIFEAQLKLAVENELPVIVHDREAHDDILISLEKYRPKGVIHCFSGNLELAYKIIDLGMYIGFGGILTFKNAKITTKVAQSIPLDKLLLETDAPYLAPEPFRGQRCDSSMIAHTASKLAAIRNISVEDLLNHTKINAFNLFNFPISV
jgi:TatD DNase family protein